MDSFGPLQPIQLSVRHQVLKVGDHLFLDEPLPSIYDNEVSLYKEGYQKVLVGGRLASEGVNNLMWPSYLVEDHRGPGPAYARLDVLPLSRSHQ